MIPADKEHSCVRKLPNLLLATNHAKKEIIKESAYFLLPYEVNSA